VTVNESGAFFFIAAAQVGGKGKGLVRMWMKINGKDVDNSNTEQLIPDPTFTAVLVCQGVAEVKRGDKITVVFSGSEVGVGLVVKKPAGEPVVPSIILSGWRIGLNRRLRQAANQEASGSRPFLPPTESALNCQPCRNCRSQGRV